MEERYSRNIPSISEEEQSLLKSKKVAVIGCGGLGGYVLEYLARLGVGALVFVDGDRIEESNLNRQIIATENSMGQMKVHALFERLSAVNSAVHLQPVSEYLTPQNAPWILSGADLVIDALDSPGSRLMLEDILTELSIPLIHGAISGWDLQVALIPPGTGYLHQLYARSPGNPIVSSTLSFVPPCCAAMEVSLAVQTLLGIKNANDSTLCTMSMQSFESYFVH